MRSRNETRWNVPFHHYASLEAFLAAPLQVGGNTFRHHGREIDVLIENRRAATTLVVFNGAIPLNVQYLPYFTGRGIAEDLGLNLIAVSDPVLAHRDMTVAWYLGDETTGPLRPILVPAIQHALEQLGADQTILFGASGGGFAAAHYAPYFPNCTALLVNPRLTLERRAQDKMATYLRLAHGLDSNGAMTSSVRGLLADFGPTDLAAVAQHGLNHDLLIYQNFFDSTFLQHHLLPFLRVAGAGPRCYVRFTHDGHGHVPIPPATIREILDVLASDRTAAVDAAGFSPASEVSNLTGQFLPEIAERLDSLGKENRRLGRERDALEVQQVKLQERVADLRSRSDALDDKIRVLNRRVEHLRTEPPLWRRMWHVVPRSFRERLQRFIRRKHA
ncbi:hypothetical protein [Enteractinococcus coprophilus]|nr:hypothetical protein [Enteractinococcus coprophilus]